MADGRGATADGGRGAASYASAAATPIAHPHNTRSVTRATRDGAAAAAAEAGVTVQRPAQGPAAREGDGDGGGERRALERMQGAKSVEVSVCLVQTGGNLG